MARIEGLRIQETYLNETRGYQIGESDVYDPFTEDVGRLFKSMQREYGRCTSAVYIDTSNGKVQRVGWVFSKKVEYEDSGRYGRQREFYTREVWVTLHTAPPTKTVEYHYATI